ncbi:FAD-binding and (Fe-S)-binding domain-containing protein [Arthrobacter sp. UM1]|uniref:FAD-binding and (Fe-S)-binding domain-containing protein n=1 Tax=Arthrobacter sp. UM1 TaxID=2766776 RepID=UPI001CF67360|nr:FAD-binding and (Fe-S)-binding domain-containing protein [Arthrobacter sp. UM1]MCB4208401.1 FAD-binding oxidoreductase [Arthrobacter sp. UM1]
MGRLLEKNARRIGRPEAAEGTPGGGVQPDRFPEELAGGTPEDLTRGLAEALGPEQVRTRALDLVRFASDASPYRLHPQAVVSPRSADDVARLFAYCREHGRHLTFRSGGSSLNGQSQGDDILVDVRTHFRGMRLEGENLRARPGEVLSGVRTMLALHGRKFGPDPASMSIATIGGAVSNNSGGMRCTVAQDSYHSMVDATIVLPSGYVLDTEAPDADERLAAAEPELVRGLTALRDEIRADSDLVERLRHKYTIRNTNSIRLDAFLDGDSPSEILKRLVVGAEGTLGFLAEAVLKTQPLATRQAVAWVMLPDIEQAAGYVHRIVEAGADACELLVAPVLRESVGNFEGAPASWADLPDESAALLVEVSGHDDAGLDERIAAVEHVLAEAELTEELRFTRDAAEIAQAWEIRGGLFALLGKQRPQGSALITEDLCVPPSRIGEASKDLMELLRRHGHPDYVMGHAAFGNLHFFLTPRFETPEDVEAYAVFMEEFADLILGTYDGSLKAEHGTGIGMAPFVEREWGTQAFELMWRVKDLIDPHGILAPDIKLTRDQRVHLRNFKSVPQIEAAATDCVECGFCENVCPSRNVTVTPRQRIVLRREMARQPEGSPVLEALQDEYQYDGLDTCAADGTCAVACPVSIDTGELVKELRAREATDAAEKAALLLARNWALVEASARAGLGAAGIASRLLGAERGTALLGAVTEAVRKVMSEDLVPTAREGLPPARRGALPAGAPAEEAAAVYMPACINRIFGRDGEGPGLPETVVELSRRAGKPVAIPEDAAGNCCATPFSSKGYAAAKKAMSERLAESLWRWSDGGRLTVLLDAASCTHGVLAEVPGQLEGEARERFEQVRVEDIITWTRRELLPELTASAAHGRVAVHPTCSMSHLGIIEDLLEVARFGAEEAFIPPGATCCGTAGDRGLLHPELVESATRDEREGLEAIEREAPVDAYVSGNRTCEMGLRNATGRPFEHALYLLEEATRG